MTLKGSKTNVATNGFLVLNKARGLTSMDVVRQVKRVTGLRKKVGHGGTLDPLAEGILPICFGQATRLMEYLINSTKEYRMEVRLGITTDTYDAEGQVIAEKDPSQVTADRINDALDAFRGVFEQMPPMHSALKSKGQRLYDLARQGLEVERKPREVEVSRLTLEEFKPPLVTLEAECGRGVYMRSLAYDLGEELGCGAHAQSLVRLRAGPFRMEESVTLEQFTQAADQGAWEEMVLPVDALLLGIKGAVVDRAAERFLLNGQPVSLGSRSLYAQHLESYRLYSDDGRFLAVVRFDRSNNRWDPYKVFRLSETSPYAGQLEAV